MMPNRQIPIYAEDRTTLLGHASQRLTSIGVARKVNCSFARRAFMDDPAGRKQPNSDAAVRVSIWIAIR